MSAPSSAKPAALYVEIVVDVESVLASHPSGSDKPTKVAFDPAQLIVTTSQGLAANAKGVVTLHARKGRTLRVFARSGSNNFEDAVLIAGVDGKGEALGPFAQVELRAATAVPVPGAPPPSETSVQEDFWFWQSSVLAHGADPVKLMLALYDRDDHGQPRFAGLYQWNLRFKVQGDSTSTTGQTEEETS